MRFHSSVTEAKWRGSVVRMKSSFEQLSAVTISRNFGVISSMNSAAGVLSVLGRRLLDFLAVLVCTGQKEDVIAIKRFEARKRISGQCFIGMARCEAAPLG